MPDPKHQTINKLTLLCMCATYWNFCDPHHVGVKGLYLAILLPEEKQGQKGKKNASFAEELQMVSTFYFIH